MLSPLFAFFPIVNEPQENKAKIHFCIAGRKLLGFDSGLFSEFSPFLCLIKDGFHRFYIGKSLAS